MCSFFWFYRIINILLQKEVIFLRLYFCYQVQVQDFSLSDENISPYEISVGSTLPWGVHYNLGTPRSVSNRKGGGISWRSMLVYKVKQSPEQSYPLAKLLLTETKCLRYLDIRVTCHHYRISLEKIKRFRLMERQFDLVSYWDTSRTLSLY